MLKLAVLLFLSSALAKLDKPSYEYIFYEQFNRVEDIKFPHRKAVGDAAWVLRLDGDVASLKLRLVRGHEVTEVFGAKGNSGFSPRQGRRVKKDDPTRDASNTPDSKQSDLDEKAMVSEIMRMINKFALTTISEPDAQIAPIDAGEVYPSLKLYFQGERTSLVMRAEGRQWHYLLGPALFPEWFYEQRPSARERTVPTTVRMEFYTALKRLLTMFLRISM